MCLAAFAINASARWPLVIASNRDEFFDRPALALARWQTASGRNIISGRDVLAGGTWLGMTPEGRVALLTNVRELAEASTQPASKSRGELVMRWLESRLDADQFMAQTDSSDYGGFNLVLGDFQTGRWTWLSNRIFDAAAGLAAHRPRPVKWQSRALAPGIYGLSNAALDTPWTKTLFLKSALADSLAANKSAPVAELEAALWDALSDRMRAGPGNLPDTGLPAEVESMLSSSFVADASRAYGTRCSTLLIAGATEMASSISWDIRMDEKTYLRPSMDGTAAVKAGEIIGEAAQWQKWL